MLCKDPWIGIYYPRVSHVHERKKDIDCITEARLSTADRSPIICTLLYIPSEHPIFLLRNNHSPSTNSTNAAKKHHPKPIQNKEPVQTMLARLAASEWDAS